MNKKEFEMLLMLYAAGIDGKMQQDEMETILDGGQLRHLKQQLVDRGIIKE